MKDKPIDTFLLEAQELIIDIEKALLQLEDDQYSKESIRDIFRAMHTLKGAGGMFGFVAVKNITHHLESVYQDIRDDKRAIDADILQLTFKTLDQLRILLSSVVEGVPGKEYDELLQTIKAMEREQPNNSQNETVVNRKDSISEKTYYIYFLPHKDTLRNGTNPLYLVDDLLVLGYGISLPFFNDLPALEDLSSESCHMGFEVLLSTDRSEADIQSVFLFIEDACELQVRIIINDALTEMSHDDHPFKTRSLTTPLGFEAIQGVILKKRTKQGTEAINKLVKAKTANIRVSSDKLDELMNLVSELVTTQASLSLFSVQNASAALSGIAENIEKITRRLRDNAFTMSLVPLDSITVRFQRLVSDLSKELNKDIVFRTEGLDTRIDKSMIEKLTDPILHILRNCIDHGIESRESRAQSGKNSRGTVMLKSYYSGSNVIIEISDDGAGLALDKIKDKAIKQGLVNDDTKLSERELMDLIFLPGFSTAALVTGISGRGVGMDVVRKNIMDIRGEVEVSTAHGKGSTFIIKLPLTLSILDGLLVNVGGIDFIIPLNAVAKCYEVETSKIESTFNQWITLDGERTPFVYLRRDFEIDSDKPWYSQVINVPFNDAHVGLVVDKIIGEYQVVLKPLDKLYAHQDEFSGATILGDGSVALVLDPNKLIKKLSTQLEPVV
jgi:two-component system chemotaxis sensor kinase CheA